ncbi:uncharacterized protein LOC124187010 [Neodiprion fabricii]|uniref:uncharacterized protein LOC124187010 n=1 Tax=Neodiprion fabricii TaxID=2872261 RepID=UPI001ED8EACF|nr:uncharacterized protein LOC124187010 [Neodiprion fabricii]XP_046435203.1 uncharacterized protein LOC124187010 [Neodiprion fabricii]
MILFGLIILSTLSWETQGIFYHIQDCEIEAIDEEWFDVDASSCELELLNDTFNALKVDLTIIKDFPEDTYGEFDAFLRRAGNYKTSAGIYVKEDICSFLNEEVMLGDFYKTIGITENNCPPKKGIFTMEKSWYPSRKLLPKTLDGMEYKTMFAITINEKRVLILAVYTDVASSEWETDDDADN